MALFFRKGGLLVPSSGVLGLIKPTGFPTMLVNSLGIIFYVVDTGTGVYSIAQDCSPGHVVDPPTYWTPGSPSYFPASLPYDPDIALTPFGSTTYGNAMLWQGGGVDNAKPGGGSLTGLASTDSLRTAVDLASAGTGAAFTMFATHMQNGGCFNGLICGRGQHLDTGSDICAFQTSGSSGSDTNSHIYFGWNAASDGSSPQFLGATDACGLNVLCTTVVTCVNTTPGVTDIKMYINGVLEAHATNQTMHDVSSGASFNEDQFQCGTFFHIGAGQQFNTFAGSVYQLGVSNVLWSQSDAANFSANPYQYLRF